MITHRTLLASGLRNSTLIALPPAARIPGAHRARRGPRARRPDPGRAPARRRQRRHQYGRPVPGRRVRQAPHGNPAPREAADQDQRRGRPAPGDGRRGKLLESGRLAIVPGVGYPNPNRSHFRSMAIWQSARLDERDHTGLGWVGRGLDEAAATRDGAPAALLIGPDAPPPAIRGRRSVSAALARLDDYAVSVKEAETKPAGSSTATDDLGQFLRRSLLDAYTTADRLAALAGGRGDHASYPEYELARRLGLTAQLIKAGLGTRVYYLEQGGYDTHGQQLPRHAPLLAELSASLRAFLDDLAASRLADRVLVLVFSEFGRRVAENGSRGPTTARPAPVLLAGPSVRPGLHGATPASPTWRTET